MIPFQHIAQCQQESKNNERGPTFLHRTRLSSGVFAHGKRVWPNYDTHLPFPSPPSTVHRSLSVHLSELSVRWQFWWIVTDTGLILIFRSILAWLCSPKWNTDWCIHWMTECVAFSAWRVRGDKFGKRVGCHQDFYLRVKHRSLQPELLGNAGCFRSEVRRFYAIGVPVFLPFRFRRRLLRQFCTRIQMHDDNHHRDTRRTKPSSIERFTIKYWANLPKDFSAV